MPIYEYQCRSCQHHLEAMQKMSDEPLRVCPACKKDQLSRLVSASGFHLKGTGWYATDFKNKPASDAAKQTSQTSSETKSDDH